MFDRLLNQGAKILTKAAAEAIENVADEIIGGFSNADDRQKTAAAGNMTKAMEAGQEVPAGYEDVQEEDVAVKLRAVLAREFPQYEVRQEVSPTTLGGTGRFIPYDFGVYQNGEPKLFIMVVFNNTCRQREYRWSKEEAERAGVTMINFVYCFENRIDYIINRLHQYL